MKLLYHKPHLSLEELTLEDNILSLVGDGNAPAFDGYTTDEDQEIPWD